MTGYVAPSLPITFHVWPRTLSAFTRRPSWPRKTLELLSSPNFPRSLGKLPITPDAERGGSAPRPAREAQSACARPPLAGLPGLRERLPQEMPAPSRKPTALPVFSDLTFSSPLSLRRLKRLIRPARFRKDNRTPKYLGPARKEEA